MPIMTGKKKQKPVKRMPDAPENLKLSKAQFIAKYEKEKEVEAKTAEYKKKLLAGEDAKPESKNDVEVLENELAILIDEAAKAEAMADSPSAEEKAKKLKKKVVGLRMKIGKAKKALK